eukprot:152129-Chlamydomonas_euryale.AAC.2
MIMTIAYSCSYDTADMCRCTHPGNGRLLLQRWVRSCGRGTPVNRSGSATTRAHSGKRTSRQGAQQANTRLPAQHETTGPSAVRARVTGSRPAKGMPVCIRVTARVTGRGHAKGMPVWSECKWA